MGHFSSHYILSYHNCWGNLGPEAVMAKDYKVFVSTISKNS